MTGGWSQYATALPSIAAAVGRTPLVRLNRMTAGLGPSIYVKVEWYGATGSLKDRIYLHMFERAEERGDLRSGMRVLECSTGNAGEAKPFTPCKGAASAWPEPANRNTAPAACSIFGARVPGAIMISTTPIAILTTANPSSPSCVVASHRRASTRSGATMQSSPEAMTTSACGSSSTNFRQ